jgi:hypothetical protein
MNVTVLIKLSVRAMDLLLQGNCVIQLVGRRSVQRGASQVRPPGHLQHPMSQEGQKDHQGQQPPEPLPVHHAVIQNARSVQVHQSGDRETEKPLLSQGHQLLNSHH